MTRRDASRWPAAGNATSLPERVRPFRSVPAAREERGNRRKASVEVSEWPKHVRA